MAIATGTHKKRMFMDTQINILKASSAVYTFVRQHERLRMRWHIYLIRPNKKYVCFR